MQRSFDALVALPGPELLERLSDMPLSVLRRFAGRYGLKENRPDSGAEIPLEAHAILLTRLRPRQYGEPPAPACPSQAHDQAAQARVMAARRARGERLRHAGDVLQNHRLIVEHLCRILHWESGQGKAQPGPVFIQGADAALAQQVAAAETAAAAA